MFLFFFYLLSLLSLKNDNLESPLENIYSSSSTFYLGKMLVAGARGPGDAFT